MTRTTIKGASAGSVAAPFARPISVGETTLSMARLLAESYSAMFRVLCEHGMRVIYPHSSELELAGACEEGEQVSSSTREKVGVLRWIAREQHLGARWRALSASSCRLDTRVHGVRIQRICRLLLESRLRALQRAELDRRVLDRYLDELESSVARAGLGSQPRHAVIDDVERRYGRPLSVASEVCSRLAPIRLASRRQRAAIVRQNRPLIEIVARRFQGRGVALEDLTQEGTLGLMRALDKFDPARGYRFSTYAQWWIRQSVSRAVQDQGRVVRLPVHMNETLGRMRRVERGLSQRLGRAPSRAELAQELEVTEPQLDDMQQHIQRETSLHKPVGADLNGELGDLLEDATAEQGSHYSEHRALEQHIGRALAQLDNRSRFVLEARHGLRGATPLTLSDIGKQLGLTRERVRQIEHEALERLRRGASRQHLDEFV